MAAASLRRHSIISIFDDRTRRSLVRRDTNRVPHHTVWERVGDQWAQAIRKLHLEFVDQILHPDGLFGPDECQQMASALDGHRAD